jgi:hypothetical protein
MTHLYFAVALHLVFKWRSGHLGGGTLPASAAAIGKREMTPCEVSLGKQPQPTSAIGCAALRS